MAGEAERGAVSGGPGYRATALRPAITRQMRLFFIVGDILGGGIYALVGEVGDKVGGAFWTGFAVAGVVAAFTAASYAELVSKYPLAGGAAVFVHRAFKTPLLTFLIAFAVMSSGLASAATLATAFGGDYLSEFVDLPAVLVGLVVIAVLSLINFRGDQGVGLLQPRLHAGGADRSRPGGRDRTRVPVRRRRGRRPRLRVQGGRRAGCCSSSPAPPSRSTR